MNVKQSAEYLNRSLNLLDIVYKETKYVSNTLTNEADRLWDDLINDYTDDLTIYNINRASTLILILAIFDPTSHLLRIRRPR